MGFFVLSGAPASPEIALTPAMDLATSTVKVAVKEDVLVSKAISDDSFVIKLTAYNALPEQTDDTPLITGSGAPSNPEVIAARSQDLSQVLPYGTIISIERPQVQNNNCGYDLVSNQIGNYRVIADSTHARKHSQIDLLLDENNTVSIKEKQVNPSLALGICDGVTIRVVGKIRVEDIPKTQEELRLIVEGNEVAFAR